MEYEVIAPTWTYAVQVILGMLDNPDAPPDVRQNGQDELLRLARAMDEINNAEADNNG